MAYTTTTPRPVPARTAPPSRPVPPEGERTLAVLETARSVLERGWMQDGWYRTAPRSLRERLFGPTPSPDAIEAA